MEERILHEFINIAKKDIKAEFECSILPKKIQTKDMSEILLKTYNFLKYYNNNYRPIYHLESYLFYLTRIIHEF